MPTSRARKEELVAILTDRFSTCQSAVIIDYRGMSVADLQEVRRELKAEGSDFIVAKNTLVRLALENVGLSLQDSDGKSHDEMLLGMTAIAFGYETPSAPAKVLIDLQDDHEEILFKGGFFGQTPVEGEAGVKRIAKMRSKEDALAEVVNILRGGPRRVRIVASGAINKLMALKHVLADEGTEEDAA